jgi:hypothetical protein
MTLALVKSRQGEQTAGEQARQAMIPQEASWFEKSGTLAVAVALVDPVA